MSIFSFHGQRAIAPRPIPLIRFPALIMGAIGLLSCSASTAVTDTVLRGVDGVFGNGTAHTEMVVSGDGDIVSMSVVVDETALSGLPPIVTTPRIGAVLALPPGAPGTPFNHATIDWMPAGHSPAGVHDKPHFDVHFYMISEQDRALMVSTDPQFTAKLAKQPAAELIPTNYAPEPGGVQRMGAHWVDPSSPERSGNPFTSTMVYGFYDGTMIFLEPMVAKVFVDTRPNMTTSIAVPAKYPKPGAYPTRYAVRYDEVAKQYRFELQGFALRQ